MLLIDKFYQKLHTPWAKEFSEMSRGMVADFSRHRMKMSEYFSSFRPKLEMAERYILDNSAVHKILDIEPVEQGQSMGLVSAAKPSRPTIWIEYDNIYKVKNQGDLKLFAYRKSHMTENTPRRVGWLIETNENDPFVWSALAVVEEWDGNLTIFPMSLMFNSRGDAEPYEVDRQRSLIMIMGKEGKLPHKGSVWDNWRGVCWGYHDEEKHPYMPRCLDDGFSLGCDEYLCYVLAEGSMYKSKQATARGEYLDPRKHLTETFLACVEQSGGDALFLTTLLATLNEVPATVEIQRTPGQFMGIKRPMDNLEHKVITLVIPKRSRVKWIGTQVHRAVARHTKMREHEVNGHRRVLYRGTEAERTVSVKSHKRGDPKVGKIVKTFRVVGEEA